MAWHRARRCSAPMVDLGCLGSSSSSPWRTLDWRKRHCRIFPPTLMVLHFPPLMISMAVHLRYHRSWMSRLRSQIPACCLVAWSARFAASGTTLPPPWLSQRSGPPHPRSLQRQSCRHLPRRLSIRARPVGTISRASALAVSAASSFMPCIRPLSSLRSRCGERRRHRSKSTRRLHQASATAARTVT